LAADDDPPILAWLYTVARRRFADEARRRAREPLRVEAEPSIEYGPPLTRAITAALGRLAADQQEVLALKLLRGLPFAEVATRLGTTTPAAKMRFVRALQALREELRKEGLEP
jgi:RNA polymerase sigma-70 factor, ECF subfamily